MNANTSLAYQKKFPKTSSPFQKLLIDVNVDDMAQVIRVGCQYGMAELAYLPDHDVDIYQVACNQEISRPTLIFNRLRVQDSCQNKGIATRLLARAMEIVDEQEASIILNVLPYYQKVNLYGLIRLFERFGFLPVCQQRNSALMLRKGVSNG